jgi:hypothetical protein
VAVLGEMTLMEGRIVMSKEPSRVDEHRASDISRRCFKFVLQTGLETLCARVTTRVKSVVRSLVPTLLIKLPLATSTVAALVKKPFSRKVLVDTNYWKLSPRGRYAKGPGFAQPLGKLIWLQRWQMQSSHGSMD